MVLAGPRPLAGSSQGQRLGEMPSAPLEGEDIVCLALRAWDSPWKNNQQVMSLLARSNRVLYVGPPRSFRESVSVLRVRSQNYASVERRAEGLFVYNEPWFLSRIRHTRKGATVFNHITG